MGKAVVRGAEGHRAGWGAVVVPDEESIVQTQIGRHWGRRRSAVVDDQRRSGEEEARAKREEDDAEFRGQAVGSEQEGRGGAEGEQAGEEAHETRREGDGEEETLITQ